MRYRLFGNTGLKVSELCLGTVTFGEDWGFGATKEESGRIFKAYEEAGGNFIDTADSYTNGTSERYLGDMISGDRDRFVLSTKFTISGRPDDPNGGGNGRKHMMRAVDASLERLGTDHIDIYWVHAWDSATPVREVMKGLDDLVSQGKVLYVAISNAPSWVIARGNTMAEDRDWSPFVGMQIPYSLIDRTPERELLPLASATGMAVTAWSPLGGGVLTGKYNLISEERLKGSRLLTIPTARYYLNERTKHIASKVIEVAHDIDSTPPQVALNWLRQKDGKEVIPIIGSKSVDQLKEDMGCLDFDLRREEMERLDDASAIDLGHPYEFLGRESVRRLIFGDTKDLLDLPKRRE